MEHPHGQLVATPGGRTLGRGSGRFYPPPADRPSPSVDNWSPLLHPPSPPTERAGERSSKRSREEFEASTLEPYQPERGPKRHQKIADRDRDPLELQDEQAEQSGRDAHVEDDVSMNMVDHGAESHSEKPEEMKDDGEGAGEDYQTKKTAWPEVVLNIGADIADISRRFPHLALIITQQPPTKMWKGIYIKPSIVVEVRGLTGHAAAELPMSSLTVHASLFLYDEKTHELGRDASEFMAGEHQAVVDADGKAVFSRLRINTVSRKCEKKHFSLTFALFYNEKRLEVSRMPTVPFQVMAIPHKKKKSGEPLDNPPATATTTTTTTSSAPMKPAALPTPSTSLFAPSLLQPLFGHPAHHHMAAAMASAPPQSNRRDATTQTEGYHDNQEELDKLRREYYHLQQQRENDNHAFNMALFQLQQQNLELHRKIVSLSRSADVAPVVSPAGPTSSASLLRAFPSPANNVYMLPPTAAPMPPPMMLGTPAAGPFDESVMVDGEFSRLLFGTAPSAEKHLRQWLEGVASEQSLAGTAPSMAPATTTTTATTGTSARSTSVASSTQTHRWEGQAATSPTRQPFGPSGGRK